MKSNLILVVGIICLYAYQADARDHGHGGGPPTRAHTATKAKKVQFEPSTIKLKFIPQVTIRTKGEERLISSNGIPGHLVGRFPNCGNPHSIEKQNHHPE